VVSTRKVPARMIPAEVITPPVRRNASWVPARVPRAATSSRTRDIRKMV